MTLPIPRQRLRQRLRQPIQTITGLDQLLRKIFAMNGKGANVARVISQNLGDFHVGLSSFGFWETNKSQTQGAMI